MSNHENYTPATPCRGEGSDMKQDYRRPLNYRRHPNYANATEALYILGGVLVTCAVLFAAYVFGPEVYPWLESIGVGG